MAHTRLCFLVTDQELELASEKVIATGDRNTSEVEFVFQDTQWNDFNVKTAVFLRNNPEYTGSALVQDNVAIIPAEALAESGKLYIGLLGTNDSAEVKTTEVIGVQITRGALGLNAVLLPPNSEVYLEILQTLADVKTRVIDLAERYAKGTVDGVPVEEGEVGYHDNAKYYKELAEDAKTNAVNAKTDAVNAKNDANQAKTDAVNAKNDAVQAKTDAVNAKTDSVNAKNDAISAKNDAVSAKNDAVNAKGNAESARDLAIQAKESIEQMIARGLEGIYGAKFTKTSSSGTHTRSAVGLTYRRYVGNSGTQTLSDFRSIGWWSLIKNVLKDPTSNALVAVEGDTEFETLKASNNYNLFVRFPKYYYDVIKTTEEGVAKVEFLMSLKPFAGCKVLRAFKDKDYVDISAFKTDSSYNSKFDAFPKVNTTLSTFITNFNSKNQRNQTLLDEYVWLIPMIIETASLNSQNSVGYSVYTNNYGNNDTYKVKEATSSANTVTILKSRTVYVGETICLENSNGALNYNRRIVSIADHPSDSTLQVITFDGEPLSLTTSMFCDVHVQRSPLVAEYNVMGKNLGYYDRGSQGRSHVYVYGLVDPWGNVFEGLSGTLRYNNHMWVNWTEGASIPSSFSESDPPEGWHKLDAYGSVNFSGGYINGWDVAFDYDGQLVIFATSNGGSSDNPIGDYHWNTDQTDLRFPWLGGAFNDSLSGGAFSLVWTEFTYSGWIFSARSVG